MDRPTAAPPTPQEPQLERSAPMPVAPAHVVNGNPLTGPWPDGARTIILGMGCFWEAERLFWPMRGVHVTAVGYSGGTTPDPTYRETGTSRTGHAHVVLVVYEPSRLALEELFRVFWENHDPTRLPRDGDVAGSPYRSVICTSTFEQQARAVASRGARQATLRRAGYGEITTEVTPAGVFHYAEDEHQQYLARNPAGFAHSGPRIDRRHPGTPPGV